VCIFKIAATVTINSTRRTAANGGNNTGQRLAEAIGLLVGLVEGEGIYSTSQKGG